MISSRTFVCLLSFAAKSACLAASACAGSVLAHDGWPGTPQVLVDLHGSSQLVIQEEPYDLS